MELAYSIHGCNNIVNVYVDREIYGLLKSLLPTIKKWYGVEPETMCGLGHWPFAQSEIHV